MGSKRFGFRGAFRCDRHFKKGEKWCSKHLKNAFYARQ